MYCSVSPARYVQFLLLVYLFLNLPVLLSSREKQIILDETMAKITVGEELCYYRDSTHVKTIRDIAALDAKQFEPMQSDIPNFGYSLDAYWFKFTIQNHAAGTILENWYLEFGNVLDEVALYIPHTDGSYRVKRSGRWEPFSGRDVLHRHITFHLPVYPASQASQNTHLQTYYIRCASQTPMIFSLSLFSEEGFLYNERKENLLWGVFFGVIVFIIFYNSIMLFYLRELRYFFYLSFMVSFLIYQVCSTGFLGEYIFPNSTPAINLTHVISASASLFFFFRFAVSFLKNSRISYRSLMIIKLSSFLLLLPAGIVFWRFSAGFWATVFATMVTVLFILGLTVIQYGRRKQYCAFFLYAWTPFLFVVFIETLQQAGIRFPLFFPSFFVPLFLCCGTILFSFHHGYRMILLHRQRQIAENEARRLSDTNRRLQDFAEKIEMKTKHEERITIAREVHDTVGYALTTVLSQVHAMQEIVKRGVETIAERLSRVERIIRVAIQEVRDEISVLRNESMDTENISIRLVRLAEIFTQSTSANVITEIGEGLSDVISLEETGMCEDVYRIVQEALTNAYRHGRADTIFVTLHAEREEGGRCIYTLTVEDNGEGVNHELVEGSGLKGMRERVEKYQGSITIVTEKEKGFRLIIILPSPVAEEGGKPLENHENTTL